MDIGLFQTHINCAKMRRKTVKKILVFLIAIVTTLSLAIPAFADSSEETVEIVNFEDGSYAVITISPNIQYRSGTTISKNKDFTYFNTENEKLWKVTLSGTFAYVSGVSSSCTSANITYTNYSGGWSCSSKNAYTSGNSAIGNATIVLKILGVQVDSIPVSLTLTCDKYGNVT